MATTKHTKKNIVLEDEYNIILRREKNFKYSYCQRQFAIQGSNLKCAKEKQQLKKDRAMEKKAHTIMRKYSVYEKYQKEDGDDDDIEDECGVSESVQWEHQGCNAVCKADKCIWWLLESGLC